MTAADQIVRHLLENEENFDDADETKDVGLPVPIGVFLGKHGFSRVAPRFMGFEKVWPRSSNMLRISDPRESGARVVQYYGGGALPLWTKEMTDEEVVDMLDRIGRIGESEEDLDSDDDDLVRDMAANSLLDQVKRDYFRGVFHENYPEGDSRVLVKDCLARLGVPWANASLIALEQGSSQAYVSRKYLADVGLQDAVLRNAAAFIKFVYRIQNDESALEKYEWMLGEAEEEDFGDEDAWKDVSLPPQENITWDTLLKYFPNTPETLKGDGITLRPEDSSVVIHHRLGLRKWRYDVFRIRRGLDEQGELIPLGSFNDYIEALQACMT